MPEAPHTASFHVSAVAATRTPEGIRVLLRTQETGAFALVFSDSLAAQIGLRVIAEFKPVVTQLAERKRKAGSGRPIPAATLAAYQSIAATLAAHPGAFVARVCRTHGIKSHAYYNWVRRGQFKALTPATAESRATNGSYTR